MKKKTTEEFISDAVNIHGDKYDYSFTEYVNNKTKLKIVCPIHGTFEQQPNNHLNGRGCKKCGSTQAGKKHRTTTEKFISKSISTHGNRYDYSKAKYITKVDKIEIVCKVHGSFWQLAGNHEHGDNCPKCSKLTSYRKKSLTTEEFINTANKIHENKYDYSGTIYVNYRTPVNINCKLHGVFTQPPGSHLKGYGCPGCSSYGFDGTKPTILYYLRIDTDLCEYPLYKIGITNRTVNERFNLTDLNKITIVSTIKYSSGQEAREKEQQILKEFKHHRYKGPDLLSSGNTELLTADILGLD